MSVTAPGETIATGRAALGIELGSTRIKACLVDADDPSHVLATGSYEWENELVEGVWTYSLADVRQGLQAAYAALALDVADRHGVTIERLASLGVSAMMHGYLAFDAAGELLTPFRTWRNTSTAAAASELSALLGTNIPLRWSIAHLHQAVLDAEPHVPKVAWITTLAGHVHELLTGRRVLGVGDASGMFPIDPTTPDFDASLLQRYDQHVAPRLHAPLRTLLPTVLAAGEHAGGLTEHGARLLDASGTLRPGAPTAPPEGDAGTGMVATASIAQRTGNVSAGTSVFAMVVLERPLEGVHHEIDLVTTPTGDAVAMVHCNNGASELAAWAMLLREFADVAGSPIDADRAFELLLSAALSGPADADGILVYNHSAGEPIVGTDAGRPMLVRGPESTLSLATFARAQVYGVFATLALGMRLLEEQGVAIDRLLAHGGIFRTEGVAQRLLAAAVEAPVAVASTASEGGAWGMAVLAAFAATPQGATDARDLDAYLREIVFVDMDLRVIDPDEIDVAGFRTHLDRYRDGLAVQRAAIAAL